MNDKTVLKSGIWYIFSNFFLKGIGFITTPIFARLLTKNEFGLYNNYLAWVSFFVILVTLNLEASLVSAKFEFKTNIHEYISSILLLSTISALVWGSTFCMYMDGVKSLTGLDSTFIYCMIAYLVFFPAITIFQNNEQMSFNYKSVVICSVTLSVFSALLPLLLVLNVTDKLDGMIIGSALPTIIIGAMLYALLMKRGKTVNLQYWCYAIPICLPYIPHLLGGMVLSSMDRIMINKWCGPEDTALYSMAYTCGLVIMLLTSAVNSSMAPWLCLNLDGCAYGEIRKKTKYIILVFCYISIGVLLMEPEILLFLGGSAYMEAKYVIVPVVMGGVCQFIYTLFATTEQFYKQTKGMAMATVVAAGINFCLNYVCIPVFGYFSAAVTTLIGYLCLLLIHQYLVCSMGYKEVFDVKSINNIVLIYGLIALGIAWLYSYDCARAVVVIIYLCATISIVRKKYSNLRTMFRMAE